MVGVSSYILRFGTVAIFATLFAAIHVNGEKGCIVDFEHTSDFFDLECNGEKSSWVLNEAKKDSPNKKVLSLAQGKEGCLKTKTPVSLNNTCPVALRFLQDTDKDGAGHIILTLIPTEGSCPNEECFWNITGDAQFKPEEWVTAEHKFPLKSTKEYYIQLHVTNNKGKVLLDRFILPSVNSEKCFEMSGKKEKDESRINLPDPLVGVAGNETNDCNLVELSKNLMLTSASVLTLNNLFN